MNFGKIFEYNVLGTAVDCVQAEHVQYLPYQAAVTDVKNHQATGWDPTDPPTRITNDLHAHVALMLALDDWSELKLYSAVGHCLDYFHGIDAFFEWQGHTATLDLSTTRKERFKADFVFTPKHVENQGALQELAKQVARRLAKGVL